MKVAPTVRAGGKGSDNFKPLPICHQEGLGCCGSLFLLSQRGRIVEEGI